MPAHLRLQLTLSTGGTFEFDLAAESWAQAPKRRFFKESANPPELERIEVTWVVTNALLVATTQEALFDAWQAFEAYCDTRTGTRITAAKLIRDPDGSAVTEETLGPSTYQEFRLEESSVSRSDAAGAASFLRSVVPVSFRLTAARVFPDSNGVVGWSQRVTHRWPDGLHVLEYVTEIATAEGTDAVAKAQTYAKIDISDYGTTYVWDTNGPDGIEYEILDADVVNGRTPTRVRATSRIKQFSAAVGDNDPQAAPNAAEWSIETYVEGTEQRTTTRAQAFGPGAYAWVLGKRPSGGLRSSRVLQALMPRQGASGEWVQGESNQSEGEQNEGVVDVKITISGGGQAQEYVLVGGGRQPRLTVGPVVPYEAVVVIRVQAFGATVSRESVRFPGKLGAPWVLVRSRSSEDAQPRLLRSAPDPEGREWVRDATYVYQSPEAPTGEALSLTDEPVAGWLT